MEEYLFEYPVTWAQIDANAHLRHSAYADFAAQARMDLLSKIGLDFKSLVKLHLGPVLFKEELNYLKEIRLGDKVKVSCELSKMRTDGSKWSFHQVVYNSKGDKCAEINVEGAWMDLEKRKVTGLSEEIIDTFLHKVPQTSDFQLEEKISH